MVVHTFQLRKNDFAQCGLINIRNEDEQCFMWCMKYHQSKKDRHDSRVSALSNIEDKYNDDNISFSVSFEDIEKLKEKTGMHLCV